MSVKAYCVVNGERSDEPLRADEIVIEVAPQRELRLSLADSEDLLTIRLEWREEDPQTLMIHPGAANLIRVGIRSAPARST
ncbi:MAG: hypothetical protein WBD40_03220 [Tepidisphaeraceae bacterium]